MRNRSLAILTAAVALAGAGLVAAQRSATPPKTAANKIVVYKSPT